MYFRQFLPILVIIGFHDSVVLAWESRTGLGLGQERVSNHGLGGAIGSAVSFEALTWLDRERDSDFRDENWVLGVGLRSQGSGGAIGSWRFSRLHSGPNVVLKSLKWRWECSFSPHGFQESYQYQGKSSLEGRGWGVTLGSKKILLSGRGWSLALGGYWEWREGRLLPPDTSNRAVSRVMRGTSQGTEVGVIWML